ncbi:hypothetical protein HGRIS_009998 [Hohenbuehelia grisea]|uniref:Peptidase A1 domain-containing protein n=1 Tax=Hohenbuehelia grisea TaxID=104357 RepID=A0ABR3J2W7_9AGAR
MIFSSFLCALAFLLTTHQAFTAALIMPVKQAKRHQSLIRRSGSTSFKIGHIPHPNVKILAAAGGGGSGKTLNLDTVRDLIYLANVTVGGNQYTVQLDTGSSDLWIKGPSSPLPNARQTDTTYNVTYGIGWAYGHVSYADVEFANLHAKDQAYLDVTAAQNPALSYNAVGILGLGFTSLSTVDALVNKTGANTGRSVLYNLFEDNPSEPNFIAFALQRSTQHDDDVEGSFSIGEYEPAYADIANNPAIPTWPVAHPKRWNVLLDAVLIGNQTVIPTTIVPGAPSNKAVVLLDSGTSYTYAPKEICDAIYGGVAGAKYDPTLGQWVVPCGAEIDMALQIGGQVFPLHPLDVSPAGLSDSNTCVGSFVPQSVAVGAGEFDWLIGDNVLRSVYSVYDFGDFDSEGKMGDPYVRLRSLVDPDEASVEFTKIRGGSPNKNIVYYPTNAASSQSSTIVTLSTDLAKTIDLIGKFFPAVLGVMALNGLVLLGILVLGIVYLCRRRRRARAPPARTPLGRLTPMPVRQNSLRNSPMPPSPTRAHTYEPVSMALTEDTMMVPSPGFKVYDGEVIKAADRPMSMMPSQSYSSYQSPSSASSAGPLHDDNALFVPPSPAFRDRPRSVA